MAERPTDGVHPDFERVSIRIRGDLLHRFEAFIRKMGWAAEDAVRILLAYPAVVARGAGLSPGDVRDELGAARAELATLRHRAYTADQAILALEMNVTGVIAAVRQFEKSLPVLEREETDLRARLEILLGDAARRGVTAEPTTTE